MRPPSAVSCNGTMINGHPMPTYLACREQPNASRLALE